MRWIAAGLLTLALGAGAAGAAPLSMQQVNKAQWSAGKSARPSAALITKAQVLLDRAFFSPGALDGTWGSNVKKALQAFQKANGLPPTGKLDEQTWSALSRGKEEALTRYTLAKEDVAGPFVSKVPSDLKKMAKLKRLGYTSPVELVSEKFHMSPRLLKQLNPGVDFKRQGAQVVVAKVAGLKPKSEVAKIVVDKQAQAVRALDRAGQLVAFYPATVGSSDFPSPSGALKVTGVAENPTFTHSAKLDYSKLKKGQVLTIAAGPNNPVGAVWIDLNKRGYGIHGTPEPTKVSKAQSHGCVRLTNWDARELAQLVKPGVPVTFSSGISSQVAGKRQEKRR
jgi:lipoprotein-anchoring transpeptidase ErfK/SrfK